MPADAHDPRCRAEVDRAVKRLDRAARRRWSGTARSAPSRSPPFDAATVAAAQHVAALTAEGALISVAGGGDTVAALAHAGVADDFTYVSTAGGAFLEWLEGKTLPGVDVLHSQT